MYRNFAKYWDLIAAENFEVTRSYLSYLEKSSGQIFTVLELGCGTGFNLRQIEQIGDFDLTGVDRSAAMLRIGKRKGGRIRYIRSDMIKYQTKRRFDLIFSANDSINHLLNLRDWGRFFKSVANLLAPGGVFLFDVATPHFFESFIKENGYFWSFPGCYLHFSLSRRARVFRWNVRIFQRTSGSTFRFLTDDSDQIGVPLPKISALLRRAGFKKIELFSDEKNKSFSRCDRVYYKCSL